MDSHIDMVIATLFTQMKAALPPIGITCNGFCFVSASMAPNMTVETSIRLHRYQVYVKYKLCILIWWLKSAWPTTLLSTTMCLLSLQTLLQTTPVLSAWRWDKFLYLTYFWFLWWGLLKLLLKKHALSHTHIHTHITFPRLLFRRYLFSKVLHPSQ